MNKYKLVQTPRDNWVMNSEKKTQVNGETLLLHINGESLEALEKVNYRL